MTHVSVLTEEIFAHANLKPNSVFVDATVNGGGHAAVAAERFGQNVTIIGLDVDADALERARERLESQKAKFELINQNFRNIDGALREHGIRFVDFLLFDFGFSSNQLEESRRGFSFLRNEPLLMTLSSHPKPDDLTAAVIVNQWPEEDIARILLEYGEEKHAYKIARAIVAARRESSIVTTFDLVKIIESAVPVRFHHSQKINPATKTFQALRIAVNDELGAITDGLHKGFSLLSSGGRMAAISFHSLEDRIVKNYFRDVAGQGTATLITKKPIVPTAEEIANNSRSRSAKLRILEKI